MRILSVALLLAFITTGFTSRLHATESGPSFDCNKAKSLDEIAICDSQILSILDRITALGFEYVKQQHGLNTARKIGRQILKERNNCGDDFFCISNVQRHAITLYKSYGAPLGLPDETKIDNRSIKKEDGTSILRKLEGFAARPYR